MAKNYAEMGLASMAGITDKALNAGVVPISMYVAPQASGEQRPQKTTVAYDENGYYTGGKNRTAPALRTESPVVAETLALAALGAGVITEIHYKNGVVIGAQLTFAKNGLQDALKATDGTFVDPIERRVNNQLNRR